MLVGGILPIPNLNLQFAHAGAQAQFLPMPMPQAALALGGNLAVFLGELLQFLLHPSFHPFLAFGYDLGLDFSKGRQGFLWIFHGARSRSLLLFISLEESFRPPL
jgi:hypothetical protein